MILSRVQTESQVHICPVADPELPRGGGAPTPGGANILFGQFSPKTTWKWRNFGPVGGAEGRVPRTPLDAQLLSESIIKLSYPFWTSRVSLALDVNGPEQKLRNIWTLGEGHTTILLFIYNIFRAFRATRSEEETFETAVTIVWAPNKPNYSQK